jgi:hypothetical protein
MAALALASCSSNSDIANDVVPSNNESTQTPVTFGTYVGKSASTRAAATGDQTTTSLQTYGFGVIAYYTGSTAWAGSSNTTTPNFFYNTKVSGENWTYSPVRYWPNDETNNKVSFFAYAPYTDVVASTGKVSDATTGITALTTNAATGEPKVTYVLGAENAASVDLLYGTTSEGKFNTDLTKQKTSEKVTFLFKHALAKFGGTGKAITVKANPDDASTTNIGKQTFITVKEIKIEGVGGTSANTYKSGTLNLATGKWEFAADNADKAADNVVYYDLKSDGTGAAALNTAIAEPSSFSASNTLEYVTTTAKDALSGDGASSYIIPAGGDQTLKVTVDYIVRTIDANLAKGYTEVEQTLTKTVIFTGGFAANKAYKLNIILGLNSVNFTATAEDWTTATTNDAVSQDVELPVIYE